MASQAEQMHEISIRILEESKNTALSYARLEARVMILEQHKTDSIARIDRIETLFLKFVWIGLSMILGCGTFAGGMNMLTKPDMKEEIQKILDKK